MRYLIFLIMVVLAIINFVEIFETVDNIGDSFDNFLYDFIKSMVLVILLVFQVLLILSWKTSCKNYDKAKEKIKSDEQYEKDFQALVEEELLDNGEK